MAPENYISSLYHIRPLVNPPDTKNFEAQQSHMMQSPNSATVLAYIQQKLRILPSLYRTYEAGIRAVFDLVDQDFEPNQRPLVMGVFWEVFYGLHNDKEYAENVGSADVWAQWREECQIHLTNYLVSQDVAPQYATSSPPNSIYKTKADNTWDSDTGCNNLSFGPSFPTHSGRARLVDIPSYASKSHLDVTSDTMLDVDQVPKLVIPPEIKAELRQDWRRNSLSSTISADTIPFQYQIGQDVGTRRHQSIDNMGWGSTHGLPARLGKATSEDDLTLDEGSIDVYENARATSRPYSDNIGDLLLPIREIGRVRSTAKSTAHARSFESPRKPGYLIFSEAVEDRFPERPEPKYDSLRPPHKPPPGMRKPGASGYSHQKEDYHRISGDLAGQSLKRSLHTKAYETSFFGKTIKDIPSVDVKAAAKLLSSQFVPSLPRLGARPVTDKRVTSELSFSISTPELTAEDRNPLNLNSTDSPVYSEIQGSLHELRAMKGNITKTIGGFIQDGIGGLIQEGLGHMPHLGKKSSKEPHRPVISAPLPTENPLLSNSTSTPNMLLSAIPISQIPRSGSVPLQKIMSPGDTVEQTSARALNTNGRSATDGERPSWEANQVEDFDESHSSGQEGGGPSHEDMANATTTDPKPPAISISPFDQAALYGWMECAVVQACSHFLGCQKMNLDIDLLKKEVKKWREVKIRLATGEHKRRDKVMEFMFGMEVQCRLLEGNIKNLTFSGIGSKNVAPIISAWKNLIPSFYPRTYCLPDYLILEHLRIVEKVLNLFGPAYYDAAAFEKKRSEAFKTIMRSGEFERERAEMATIRALQEERKKAEEDLLREIGILVSRP